MRQRSLTTLAFGTLALVAACNNESTSPAATNALTITKDLAVQTSADVATNVGSVINSETITGLNLVAAPGVSSLTMASRGGWTRVCTGPDTSGWYTCGISKEDDNLSVTRSHRFWKGGTPVPISGTPYDSVQYRWREVGVDSGDVDRKPEDGASLIKWVDRSDTSSVGYDRVSTPNKRIWNWTGQRNDSSLAVGTRGTRFYKISGSRVGLNVTWNLPRSANPWPKSGTATHVWNATVVFTAVGTTKSDTTIRSGTTTITFDGTQTPKVTVGGLTCTIDLQTRKTSNCS